MASLMACLMNCIKQVFDYICKHYIIILGIFVVTYILFIFLLSLPLIPIEPILTIAKFFFIMLLISFLAAKCIVERGLISKEPRSLSTVGIAFIITGVVTALLILFINVTAIEVPEKFQDRLLQISLHFLLAGVALIGVAFPILLSSMRGECCCKTERPSQHIECNTSKKESEGEKGGH